MTLPATIWWIRRDARLADNTALHEAVHSGGAVIPLYIHAPGEEHPWEPGAASRWWQHHSLAALDKALRRRNSRLIIRRGESLQVLRQVAGETGAGSIVWNRLYEPDLVARDERVGEALRREGHSVRSFPGALLHDPTSVCNSSGKPFLVYTPFWKHLRTLDDPPAPLPVPGRIPSPADWPESIPLEDLQLLPRVRWDTGLAKTWTPGEAGGRRTLDSFLGKRLAGYDEGRDSPGLPATSRLSPFLHHGELTPRQLWHEVRESILASHGESAARNSCWAWLRQLAWREFSHHLLFHFPHTAREPLRPEFAAFPWEENGPGLVAWQKGRTGYPLIDAGMRELWHTGWMHNRVRMVAASFLVKHLRISWLRGAEWFWDTLVDASLANNTMGWQWTAGSGADAAPYFRVFNPIIQGEKFDPLGHYTRHWVPELAKLPKKYLHSPWEADGLTLAQSRLILGEAYPYPVVDHREGRAKALQAYEMVKKKK